MGDTPAMKILPIDPEHTRGPRAPEFPLFLRALPTPALLVDATQLERNLAAMQQLAEECGVRLRPHAKSHKSLMVGRRQLEHGAAGLCVAKIGEAAIFASAGFEDLLVAYPTVGWRAEAAAELAEHHPRLRLAVAIDSADGVRDLARAVAERGVTLTVWIKIDSGLHRAGLAPEDPSLLDMARLVHLNSGLRLRGLLTHGGHVYRAQPNEVAAIGRMEAESMVRAAARLTEAGLGPIEVGLGATPSIASAARVPGVHEIHPGVYVFGDRQQVALGGTLAGDVSLSVLSTVVSRPAPGRWIVDAGSKTLSSDRGAHGSELIRGFGAVRRVEDVGEAWAAADAPMLARLSEEHGVIEDDRDWGWTPGDLVEIIPNHACPVVNLAEFLYVTEGEGADRRVVAMWPVEARGRVQ
jgi:D-serine deaminase-like pyridoxal phosphate-dependent protein